MSNVFSTAELNEIGRWLYESTFFESFYGKINWGSKMLGIAGNCNSNGQIVLNKNYYLQYGKEEVISVLKHELTHLYCFKHFGTHSDEDDCFKENLNKIGGIEKAHSIPKQFFVYSCPYCQKKWFFESKLEDKQLCKECFEKYNKKMEIVFLEKRKLY